MDARYSASQVLRAMVICFLEHHATGAPNEMSTWTVVDRLSLAAEKSASAYDEGTESLDCWYSIPWDFVPIR